MVDVVPFACGVVGAGAAMLLQSRRGGSKHAQRDPQRAFTEAQRRTIFARAGDRCEHTSLLGRRCKARPTHADHVHPWSRGGATTLANAQALCARHNLAKSDHVPSPWYLHGLERRRRSYFPPGEPVQIVWRVGVRR